MATGAPQKAAAPEAADPPKADTGRKDMGPGSLAGNLTEDPSLRYTPTGRAVVSCRVAVQERVYNEHTKAWDDKPAEFFTVTCWPPLAERVAEHLQRGDRIVAEGRWESRSWEDKEGNVQERVEFVATDLGPSLKWLGARVIKAERRTR